MKIIERTNFCNNGKARTKTKTKKLVLSCKHKTIVTTHLLYVVCSIETPTDIVLLHFSHECIYFKYDCLLHKI